MRVHPSQLISGCVLLKDVTGKSGRPIMKENTVITEEHITVLHKFFIPSVEVSSKLVDGKKFVPKDADIKLDKKPTVKDKEIYLKPEESRSFPIHFLEVAKNYKQFFTDWNNGVPINISKVRKSIIPLLERIEDLDMEIYNLHQYSSAEDYLYHHSVAVSLLSAFIGKELGYRKGEWIQLGLAGFLCDAGMTRVDPAILNGIGPLTEQQHEDIKNHATYSYRMVENITGLSQAAKLGILQHHERMDGSGYPLGLNRDKINQYARILAVSDTYHAMSSERFYRPKQPIFMVVREISQDKYSRLDPFIVRAFMRSLSRRAVGKTVYLSNGKTGEIAYMNDDNLSAPLVRLHETGEVISLMIHSDLEIEEIIID